MGKKMKQSAGFSLIELAVTMAILGVLIGIAVPSFREFVINNRLMGSANELMAAVNYARNEAVTRGVPVTLCRSSNTIDSAPTCATSGGWEQGWIIFVDLNGNSTPDYPNDALLRVGSRIDNLTINGSGGGLDQYLIYIGTGERRLSSGVLPPAGEQTLTVCLAGYYSRTVGVTPFGRPSLTVSADKASSC